MLAREIIEKVGEDGFCIFELDKETKGVLAKVELNDLEDGFHVNNNIHSDFVSSTTQIKSLIGSLKDFVSNKNIAWNMINVARVVKKSSPEKYRTHFDSHLYTLVVPLMVSDDGTDLRGQLYLAPNLRKQPVNDLINVLQKTLAFRWRGEKGFLKLKSLDKIRVFDLKKGQAILFNGSRSLHGNLENASNATRITLITHMSDPFPHGIGSWVRKIRSLTGMRK
tara:strand:- start:410 stop:1078 length:669 start_codon:yes stop_codon:yes gene_type:complete